MGSRQRPVGEDAFRGFDFVNQLRQRVYIFRHVITGGAFLLSGGVASAEPSLNRVR